MSPVRLGVIPLNAELAGILQRNAAFVSGSLSLKAALRLLDCDIGSWCVGDTDIWCFDEDFVVPTNADIEKSKDRFPYPPAAVGNWYGTPVQVLKRADMTLSQTWFDATGAVYALDDTVVLDIAARRINPRTPTSVNLFFSRVLKYINRGFTLSQGDHIRAVHMMERDRVPFFLPKDTRKPSPKKKATHVPGGDS
jgi:hypothetical protein